MPLARRSRRTITKQSLRAIYCQKSSNILMETLLQGRSLKPSSFEMAQPEPAIKLFLYMFAGLLVIALAIFLSPFVLVAGVVFLGIKFYEWYHTNPVRLAKLEGERQAAFIEQATKPPPMKFPDADTVASNIMTGYLPKQSSPPVPQIIRHFLAVFDVLYTDEKFDTLPHPPISLSGIDGARY